MNDSRKSVALWRSLRPMQWLKNGFVLLPVLFARKLLDGPAALQALEAAVAFCGVASAVYLVNDVMDVASDRAHPVKRSRPIAAGLISPGLALTSAATLLLAGGAVGAWVGERFLVILVVYGLIQLLYSYRAKEVVILDIFCISSGYFLRVMGGAVAIDAAISHWLIVCSVLISMFLALAKRRHELVLLGEKEAGNHRRVLQRYSPYLLDQMISIITACTILSYMLYCVSQETIEKFGTDHMIYSSPLVLYGVFRYLYLVHQEQRGGEPERVLVSDPPLLLSLILWALSCFLVVYGVI